jgi:seryl-tRNA synthetase
MHDIAFDSDKTNQIVENIIQSKDETGLLRKYYEHLTDLSKAISEGVFSVFQMQKEINSLKKSLFEKGKREGVNQQLSLLKAKVAELQKGAELTPEERLALDASIKQVQDENKNFIHDEKTIRYNLPTVYDIFIIVRTKF